MVAEASRRTGILICAARFADRSVFTGRHMDTGEYNPHAQPIRQAVNSLHEVSVRTDLDDLLVDYQPREGFDFLNRYYEHVQACWNTVVRHTGSLLSLFDEESCKFSGPLPEPPAACPKPVLDMLDRMRRVVEGTGWMGMGLPRENIIEPQLGYALRQVITQLQQGQGCGHGLMGIFEIDPEEATA